jgi:hypothetical protein
MINEPSDFSDLFETSETSNVQVTNLEILKLFKNIVDNNFNEGKENIESFIKKYLSSSEYEELRDILTYILEHADFEIIIRMFIDNNTKLSKLDIGFIAHEVQEYYPFLVDGEKDGQQTQSLDYISIIGILVKEIQELKQRVKQLEDDSKNK